MTEFWDDKEMFSSGDFVQFDQVGDTVTGTITGLRKHMFDDGKIVPQIELDTADGPKTLTAGQVRLKATLTEKRPKVGEILTVTLTQIEKRQGGRTLKHFDVILGAPAPKVPPVRLADQLKADKARLAAQPRAAADPDNPPF